MKDRTPRGRAGARLVVAALSLLSIGTGRAQAQGLHAGMAISRLTDVPGLESRRGLVLGASVGFLAIGPVSLTPGIIYVQKGARVATPAESGIDDIRIDWFEVPLMFELGGYIPGSPLRPSVRAGPYFGFRTGCSFGFEDGGDRSEDCLFAGLQEIGIDGAFADGDFGWTAGAALELYTGRIGNVSIEARYSASFTDIMRRGSESQPKTRSWVITAGIRPTAR